jgi:hypothetical protein
MIRRELAERAALYRRLGFSAARAKARLRANVAWDFEIGGGGSAPGRQEIDAVVGHAYGER